MIDNTATVEVDVYNIFKWKDLNDIQDESMKVIIWILAQEIKFHARKMLENYKPKLSQKEYKKLNNIIISLYWWILDEDSFDDITIEEFCEDFDNWWQSFIELYYIYNWLKKLCWLSYEEELKTIRLSKDSDDEKFRWYWNNLNFLLWFYENYVEMNLEKMVIEYKLHDYTNCTYWEILNCLFLHERANWIYTEPSYETDTLNDTYALLDDEDLELMKENRDVMIMTWID